MTDITPNLGRSAAEEERVFTPTPQTWRQPFESDADSDRIELSSSRDDEVASLLTTPQESASRSDTASPYLPLLDLDHGNAPTEEIPLNQFLLNPPSIFDFSQLQVPENPFDRLLNRPSSVDPFGLRARVTMPDMPSWLPCGTIVRELSASENVSDALASLERLQEMAERGDVHAQTALAATALLLTGGPEAMMQVGQMGFNDSPIFVPNFAHLNASEQQALKQYLMTDLQPARTLMVDGDGKLQWVAAEGGAAQYSDEALAMFATAYVAASANGSQSEAQLFESILTASESNSKLLPALYRSIHSDGFPANDRLDRMFLDSMAGSRGHAYLDRITERATQGNPEDIRLLARALSRDGLSGEQLKEATEALRTATINGHGDKVFEALTKTFADHGDQAQLLNALGQVVADGGLTTEQNEAALQLMRDGLASDDADTQDSAARGFMRVSKHWLESDLQLLSDNFNPAAAEGMKELATGLDPERSKQFAALLTQNLNDNQYETVEDATAAITALGALSDSADASTAQAIKAAVSPPSSDRFQDSEGFDQMNHTAVHAMMSIAGSNSEGRETALSLLTETGWTASADLPMDDESFRQELADAATGQKGRSELSENARHAIYESGFPLPIPSLFRDLGVSADQVELLTKNARQNYDDATIRSILSRAAMYNALPPQLRAQLGPTSTAATGESAGPDSIDVLKVIGQMANNTLEGSSNSILLTPIEEKALELRDTAARAGRRLSLEHSVYDNATVEELEELAAMTEEGVSAWSHFTSIFGSSTLSNFTLEQGNRFQVFRDRSETSQSQADNIGRLAATSEAWTAALDTFAYQEMKASGHEDGADLFALEMLRKHGQALAVLAPEIWHDLGMDGTSDEGAETVWDRLHHDGLAQSADTPHIAVGTHEGMLAALDELAHDRTESYADTAARRTMALQAIDSDPTLVPLTQAAMELQTQLPALQQLVSAGVHGTRTAPFVTGMRELVGSFENIYQRMNTVDEATGLTPAQMAANTVAEMKRALDTADPDMKQELSNRIDAIEKLLKFLDPNSQSGMNMHLMFDQVKSDDFCESTFANWLRTDGIKTLGTIAGALALAGLVTVTMGAATPLAMAAVAIASGAGAVIGHEVTAEAMYRLGTGERTGAQYLHARRGGLVEGPDGQARVLTEGDALWDYTKQFGLNVAISLGTLGLGSIFARCAPLIRGSSALRTNAAAFQKLATRLTQIEQAAERAGGKAVLQKWMQGFAREFPEEVLEEVLGQGAEVGMEAVLGDVNPALSIFAGALIAHRKTNGGFDLDPMRGGKIDVRINEGTDAHQAMSTLHQELLNDGLQVSWNGRVDSQMTVTTPEGEVVTLQARTADGAASETSQGAETAGSETASTAPATVTPESQTSDSANETADGSTDPNQSSESPDSSSPPADESVVSPDSQVAENSPAADAGSSNSPAQEPANKPEEWTEQMRENFRKKVGDELARQVEAAGVPYKTAQQLSRAQMQELKTLIDSRNQLAQQLANGTAPNDKLSMDEWRQVLDSIDSRLRSEGPTGVKGVDMLRLATKSITDSNLVLSQLTNPDVSPERTRALKDILVASAKMPSDFQIPLGRLANPEIPQSVLETYAGLLNQVQTMSGITHRETGHYSEWRAFREISKVLNDTEWGQNGDWAFLPSGMHSQADGSGMDGVFINLKNGEIRPISLKQIPQSSTNPWELALSRSGLDTGNREQAIRSLSDFLNRTEGFGLDQQFLDSVGLPAFTENVAASFDDLAARIPAMEDYRARIDQYIADMEAAGQEIPEGVRQLRRYVNISVNGLSRSVTEFNSSASPSPESNDQTTPDETTPDATDSTPAGTTDTTSDTVETDTPAQDSQVQPETLDQLAHDGRITDLTQDMPPNPDKSPETIALRKALYRQLKAEAWPEDLAKSYVRTLDASELRTAITGLDSQESTSAFLAKMDAFDQGQFASLDEVTNPATALSIFGQDGYDHIIVIADVPPSAMQSRSASGDTSFYEQALSFDQAELPANPTIYDIPKAEFSQILLSTCSEHIVKLTDPDGVEFYTIKPGHMPDVSRKILAAIEQRGYARQ